MDNYWLKQQAAKHEMDRLTSEVVGIIYKEFYSQDIEAVWNKAFDYIRTEYENKNEFYDFVGVGMGDIFNYIGKAGRQYLGGRGHARRTQ